MTGRVGNALLEATRPPFVVGALALAIFVTWAALDAGFDVGTWSPGALFLLALLLVVVLADPRSISSQRPAVLVALGFFAAFAIWCAASIAWSDDRGIAWEGANRTILYVVVYALFVLPRWRHGTTVALLSAFGVGVALIGSVDVLRAAHGDPAQFFIYGRLAAPAGYPNAACALFVFALWPPMYLCGRRELHPVFRGGLLAVAVALADLAVLTQSRASIVAVPIGLLFYFALVPSRLRALGSAAAVALAVGASAHWLLAPYAPLTHLARASQELRSAASALLFGAVGMGLLWMVGASVDRRVRIGSRVKKGATAVVASLAAAGIVVALVVAASSSPITRVKHAWHEFQSGYPKPTSSSSHFSSGLGNNRYDFWRVAIDEFRRHPVAGVGVDNFAEDYLVARRSGEEPSYPHSLELRVLAQTGILGVLLFVGFAAAALFAAVGAFKRTDLAAGAARAGLVAVAYWAVHGSIDWFWEFPGLTAPALAWLGLAGSWRVEAAQPARPRRRLPRGVRTAVTTAVALVAAVSFLLPWWASALDARAARAWRTSSSSAFRDLDRARSLNPLSADSDLLAGAIASRLGNIPRMRISFSRAVRRDDRLWYAHFELGLAYAAEGRRRAALVELARARRLDPRESLIEDVLNSVRAGRRIDRAEVDRTFVGRVAGRVGARP